MKKKIFILFFFFLIPLSNQGETLFSGDWKIDIDESSGRFILYYKELPINQVEKPITSFPTVKINNELFRLGQDVSVASLEKKDDRVFIVYRVTSGLLIEVEIGFKENPLVYDEKGVEINFRLDARFDLPTDLFFKFLFDSFTGEDKMQNLKLPFYSEEDISSETEQKADTVVFYPFFIKSITWPSFVYLASWERLEEEFKNFTKPLVNFRNVRNGKWDPALAFYYDLGKIQNRVFILKLFVGLWQKPNRTYPRIKIYHPAEFPEDKKQLEIPLMIENNGDYDIDFYKIALSSSDLTLGEIIRTEEKILKKEKKQLVFKGEIKDGLNRFNGVLKVTLWKDDKSYDQVFKIQGNIKKPEEKKKQEKIEEAVSEKDLKMLLQSIEKLNLLLYFINRGLDTGISEDFLLKIRREIDELERQNTQKNE
ncbi:MAG: hypothetical protein A2Y41_08040 [Spirochaetes bacterium GWB1_36_13]|nr:MAG: hypothetical protein A2Y41_08040 [Spirochaetes bacterium GWB1_36_13]